MMPCWSLAGTLEDSATAQVLQVILPVIRHPRTEHIVACWLLCLDSI